MRSPWHGIFVALALATSACTSEASTPIDLDAPTTTAGSVEGGVPELPDDDPNADARNQVIELAKEECRKDPSAEFGTVIIADENGVEVNRYDHPCSEVRAEDAEDSAGTE